jgi:hypothetical protein
VRIAKRTQANGTENETRTTSYTTNHDSVRNGVENQRAGARIGIIPVFSSSCWKDVRPEIKYMAMEKNRGKYPIKLMCEFFEVSRSGYYAYLKRKVQPQRDETLAALIRQCQEQTHSTYGYRRVGIWLERRGIKTNHKAVLRVMQTYGLLAQIRRRRKYRHMGEQLHRYANVLNRDFSASQPNEKWVTDISYIQNAQGTLFLSMIRDLYDNSIVAYRTGTEQSINLVLNTIRDAKAKEAVTAKLQLHSDQGFPL